MATASKPVKPAKPARPARKPSTRTAPVASTPVAAPVKPKKKLDKPVKAEKTAKPVKETKAEKPRKPKLVRDSFTIPKDEYAVLDTLKARAARMGRLAKKSEVLRAGIKALEAMSDNAFAACLVGVPAIKTGRPTKAT